jgi:hypothetical protein
MTYGGGLRDFIAGWSQPRHRLPAVIMGRLPERSVAVVPGRGWPTASAAMSESVQDAEDRSPASAACPSGVACREVRRPAGVAVVEPDHPHAAADPFGAEPVRSVDHLRAAAVHQHRPGLAEPP